MNKRGFTIIQLGVFAISAIVVILFFAGWIFGMQQVEDVTSELGVLPNTNINMSSISDDTLGHVVDGYGLLRVISFLMIFGYALTILITAFLVRKNPALGFVVYLFITIISFIFAVYIVNAYEDLLLNPALGPTLQQFVASNFIMANLHTWVLVLGFAGMILIFAGIPRDRELGGGVF